MLLIFWKRSVTLATEGSKLIDVAGNMPAFTDLGRGSEFVAPYEDLFIVPEHEIIKDLSGGRKPAQKATGKQPNLRIRK